MEQAAIASANASRAFASAISATPRSVGESVQELRIHAGPGYRVYFGQDANELVILLSGGDNDSQDRDIERAHEYWRDHRSRSDG
jgi:putative addiction module killer protein